ncbi:MAG TPA: FAD-dependent oxidoreductase [Candidatus Methylomirabilis sp.]|nr:FAD-dependent oxidoreductase [Candidatus Methylomirabilis sp.]
MLVGGGHAHVQVLEGWAATPASAASLTVVVDRPVAVYSGMVPGLVAGRYRRDEIEIDVRPLAARAGARLVVARAVSVDASRRRLVLDGGGPPLGYDTASFDIGATVSGLDTPGVREHALPTRPIAGLVSRVDELAARMSARERSRVIVVGGGAGGVELAFALSARFTREGARGASVMLLEERAGVLPGYPRAAARRVEDRARSRGLEIRCSARVAEVGRAHVRLDSGERLDADAVLWVTGAASPPLFAASGLPVDARGFARVRATLQLIDRDELFAAGDCASLDGHPDLPKAGVHAVRQGPVLAHNLRARVDGRPLRAYRPQRDFLSLLNLGDGSAVASKWGLTAEGRLIFRLKDWIDRRFVRRFQASRSAAPR